MVEEKTGIPANMQRLVFGGKDLEDDKTNIEKEGMLHVLLRLMCGAKRKNAGDDAGDKEVVLDTNKKFINTKMIETRNCDSPSIQALRAEIERLVELSKTHPGQTLKAFLSQTSVADLKKLVEIAQIKNNEQKYRLIKGMCYPNFIRTIKEMTDIIADMEMAMMETARLLSADAFMNDGTGLISWKDLHQFCQDAISEKERQYGAHVAQQHQQAQAAQAANGMALG
jgi:hypothetical protein